jgi:hypothetical protein
MEEEMSSVPRGLGGDWAVGVDRPEPSTVNLMPGVLGDDSSSSEGEKGANHVGALPTEDASAGNTCHRYAADALVLEVFEDEAVSRSPVIFRSVAFIHRHSVLKVPMMRRLGHIRCI